MYGGWNRAGARESRNPLNGEDRNSFERRSSLFRGADGTDFQYVAIDRAGDRGLGASLFVEGRESSFVVGFQSTNLVAKNRITAGTGKGLALRSECRRGGQRGTQQQSHQPKPKSLRTRFHQFLS